MCQGRFRDLLAALAHRRDSLREVDGVPGRNI